MPRYAIGSPWDKLGELNFKQVVLICVGVSIFSIVVKMIASGAASNVFGLISTLSNSMIFLMFGAKLLPYIKDNSKVAILLLAGVGVFILTTLIGMFISVDLGNVVSTIRLLGVLSLVGYGVIAAALLMIVFSLKHFDLRTVIMLYGIGYAIMAVGSLFLFGGSLGAWGTYGIFAGIGGIIVLVGLIMLLVKVLSSKPIEDPYSLPFDK
jgi:hypothetical protein